MTTSPDSGIRTPVEADDRRGFSLIEVVVALALLAILVAVVSRGLMTSIASDQASGQIFESTLVLNRIEAASARGADEEALKALTGSGWQFAETHVAESETNAMTWRVIALRSNARPSLEVRTALRSGGTKIVP